MKAPEGSIGESLQENFSDLHALLVDERSPIGSTTLGWSFTVDVALAFLIRVGEVSQK